MSYLQDLNKNTQDESQDFAAASSSSSKTPSKAGGDQLSAKQQLPAAQQPAAAPAHQAAEEVPMSQVSQDEWGLPKVPFASQASSCSDLEVEKALPISKQTIRQEKGMKRPAGLLAMLWTPNRNMRSQAPLQLQPVWIAPHLRFF